MSEYLNIKHNVDILNNLFSLLEDPKLSMLFNRNESQKSLIITPFSERDYNNLNIDNKKFLLLDKLKVYFSVNREDIDQAIETIFVADTTQKIDLIKIKNSLLSEKPFEKISDADEYLEIIRKSRLYVEYIENIFFTDVSK